jgi:glycosyltransferase involved in cell wall biosynthesis
MHIVKVAYECTAFDVRLTRGGTAVIVWHLAREFVNAGHRVSIVTPAHGQVDYLRERYAIEELGPADEHAVPLVLDPEVWPAHPAEVTLSLSTRVHLLRRDGVDIYLLSDEYLDLLPDSLYPANELQGRDLAYFKPLVFQVDAIRFIDRFFGDEPIVVQGYDPAYHYLVPPVFSGRPGTTTVSTVVVNTRIDDMVYRPQLTRLFELLSVTVDLDRFADPYPDDSLSIAMRDYLRPSYLDRDYGPAYTCYFAMVAAHVDLVDFLSPGQRHYYSTFRDTAFEGWFQRLHVARTVQDTAHKHFVGGCAPPTAWLERDASAVDRAQVLSGLGMDPDRPTFYHAARLAHNHKGQVELFRAVDAVLRTDKDVNFVIRCAVAAGGHEQSIGDPYFQEVADRYPDNVYLDWRMVGEEILFEQAASADFCLFPSKFELDGFLITMAEAMACGAVPIATAQETLSHYQHDRPLSDPAATGFAVPRSFRSDDRRLACRLRDRIAEALTIFRHDRATYTRLSRNCVNLARTFTWERCADERLARFAQAQQGGTIPYPGELAIEYGWFDRLDTSLRRTHRDRILAAALSRGDLDAYRNCGAVDASIAVRLFDAAYRRADFSQCDRLAGLVDGSRRRLVRERCQIAETAAARRVTYHLPHADQVDLIVPPGLSTGTGRGNRYTHPLDREGDDFVGQLPAGLEVSDLVFLLTLDTGRIAWDVVPAPAAADPDERRHVLRA